MSSAASGELVLSCIISKLNELREQASTQLSSRASASVPASGLRPQLPLWWTATGSHKTQSIFFHHSTGTQTMSGIRGEAQPDSGIQYYNTPFKLMNWKPKKSIPNNTVIQLPKKDRYLLINSPRKESSCACHKRQISPNNSIYVVLQSLEVCAKYTQIESKGHTTPVEVTTTWWIQY